MRDTLHDQANVETAAEFVTGSLLTPVLHLEGAACNAEMPHGPPPS